MATGFVQRFKGKIALAGNNGLVVGGIPLYGTGAVQTLSTASANFTAINGVPVSVITASSAINVWNLPKPSFGGQTKCLQLLVSSGILVTASTDGSRTFNGSSNSVFKSTQNSIIELQATSTLNWAITGVFPGSTLVSSILTLSTTT